MINGERTWLPLIDILSVFFLLSLPVYEINSKLQIFYFVCFEMCFHVAALREFLATIVAVVWTLSCVPPDVNFQCA